MHVMASGYSGGTISVNPQELEDLANRLVTVITNIENDSNDLKDQLEGLKNSVPYEYRRCFYGVGHPGGTANSLLEILDDMDDALRRTASKMEEEDDKLSKLLKLHDQYGTLTALGALAGKQSLYYLTKLSSFSKAADGTYSFKHAKVLKDLAEVVDGSDKRRIFQWLLDSKYLLKKEFRDAPFSDLVHKRFSTYLPDELVNFTNSTNLLRDNILLKSVSSSQVKEFLKNGTKFGKANAVSTVLLTGASETFGMTLSIADNYAKYGDNIDVLKRENAKAVGKRSQ
ncbi:hypothetical protein LC087_11145 [Bacillus carboniphilus]|uniref:Uncharacterized protein n=1 Tax=Bacillus carboniphilus TaxID=86663 RepID=A0ABY9JRU0_9BACI|nr:hypothetical protein [Bacillus carboniphilus]WLR41453.1 hypothetical protein LC087_11145 [Bacillus carboniphilus]